MKFAILCNGNIFQQWQLETINRLVAAGHSCALLIVNSNPVERPGFRQKLLQYPYSRLVYRIWFRFMVRPEAKKSVNISGLFLTSDQISCFTTKKGYSDYFDKKDVESIKSHNLDFMLRFGFGIIKGEILDAAKYGVWSYHHDDDRKYRGVPTGFWEIMFGDPVNAAILQRLTNKLDSGVILRKAYFKTINHSWEANINNLFFGSTEWPLQVCTEIENGNTAFLSATNSPRSAIYKLPGNLKMMQFLVRLATNKLIFQYRDLFLTEKWNVGIIPIPIEKFIKPGTYSIPEPTWLNINTKKSVYHADPFGILNNGKFNIICEEYDYRTAKGVLVSFQTEAQSNKIEKKTISLEKDYHLAFPYLFEYQDKSYCIPENSEGGNVDLYRFDPSSGKLFFEQTLIEDLRAVDASLFNYNGFWWLFFTDRISTNERLHIWYSYNFLGPYKPHANNPVKVDVRSSRPAGNPFLIGGKLLRPSQDCAERSGSRIIINEILSLSPTEFSETEYAILNPAKNSRFADGMHTFCVTEGAVIVDGKREVFIWQAFVKKLSTKFKKRFN